MISEKTLFDIEKEIIKSDETPEDFILRLSKNKSPFLLWMSSENFEAFSQKAFRTLIFITQVLLVAYERENDFEDLSIETFNEAEEKVFKEYERKSMKKIRKGFKKSAFAEKQPDLSSYLIDFMEDAQEELEMDKVNRQLLFLSVVCLCEILEN